MPSANQLKALLQSHIDRDEDQFYSIAMQIAAHEAKLGHGQLAKELRILIDKAKKVKYENNFQPTPLVTPRGELSGLLSVAYPKLRLADIILSEDIQERLKRLISEHCKIKKLRSHGLAPRKKLLLIGPPGTGKTLTASILAGELGLPLFIVRLDSLITKFMGETAAKLRMIFDEINQKRGVYLFDEFDSIGSQRSMGNDVGEIRRILNSFLQMIEQDDSDSLLIAATNHGEMLDDALYRRFDDVITYLIPNKQESIDTFKIKLASFKLFKINWKKLAEASIGLSYGDITRVCEDAIKEMLIQNEKTIKQEFLIRSIKDRLTINAK